VPTPTWHGRSAKLERSARGWQTSLAANLRAEWSLHPFTSFGSLLPDLRDCRLVQSTEVRLRLLASDEDWLTVSNQRAILMHLRRFENRLSFSKQTQFGSHTPMLLFPTATFDREENKRAWKVQDKAHVKYAYGEDIEISIQASQREFPLAFCGLNVRVSKLKTLKKIE
jgi:hypothetical protein